MLRITGGTIDETLEIPAWGSMSIERINSGNYSLVMTYHDGRRETKSVEVGRDEQVTLDFSYRPAAPKPTRPPREPRTPREPKEKTVISENATRFNTLSVSTGSSFVDPLMTATIHGTYSPLRYMYIELGCDFGFLSAFDDVENYYSIYPFTNVGLFLPFGEAGGFFAGAGIGYMTGMYSFSYGEYDICLFGVNVTTGVNLWDFLNISYTLRTNFTSLGNKLSIGYCYRFK
jgi:hypothetical protein